MTNLEKLKLWEKSYGFTKQNFSSILTQEEKQELLNNEDYLFESFTQWCGDEFDGDYLQELDLAIKLP